MWGCQLCKISVIRVDLSGELIFDRLREAELLRVGEFEFFFGRTILYSFENIVERGRAILFYF